MTAAIRTVLAEDLPEPTVENIAETITYKANTLRSLRFALNEARGQRLRIPVIPDLDARIARQILSERAPGLDMSTWDYEGVLVIREELSPRVLRQVRDCGTTCCRGGHTILAAGPSAVPLIKHLSVGTAARLIYYASTDHVPNFDGYLDEEEVFADILARAADQGWTP